MQRALLVYQFCMMTFALFLANWRYPFLRLDNGLGNKLAAALAWLLPLVAFAMLGLRVKGTRCTLFAIAMVPAIVIASVSALVEASDAASILRNGRDDDFEPIQRIPVPDGSEIVVYRFSCAIGCGVILTVRQEAAIGGPLRIVRNVLVTGDSTDVRLVGSHTLVAGDERFLLRHHVVF